jgi:hypothetical protein
VESDNVSEQCVNASHFDSSQMSETLSLFVVSLFLFLSC